MAPSSAHDQVVNYELWGLERTLPLSIDKTTLEQILLSDVAATLHRNHQQALVWTI